MTLDATKRKQWIQERLEKLNPLSLTIIDESHLHVGHEGAKGGASHFALQIVSAQFSGLSLIKRHQLVYAQLKDYIPHEIHALKIKALSPEESDPR
jgi:BolA protein